MATPQFLSQAKDSMVGVVSRHSNFFVAISSGLILITGMAIANGKADWWVSSLAILGFFLAVFVFMNARVMVKATIATVVTVFMANFALQAGAMLSPYSAAGLLWLSAHLTLFFFVLMFSYFSIGYRSRWTAVIYSQVFTLFAGVILIGFTPPILGVGLSALLGFGLFTLYYKGLGKRAYSAAHMPNNYVDERLDAAVEKHIASGEWNARKLTTRTKVRDNEISDYLVWNDDYAFLVHPVKLENKLAISPGLRSSKLVHKGRSINPWLLYLVNKRIPLWKSKNAPIFLVLLDVDNTNGTAPEAIGVSIPDSKKKIPVGIYPGKKFAANNTKKPTGLFDDLVKKYAQYSEPLTEKQKKAMSEIGVTDESEYLDSTETTDKQDD